MGSLCSKCLKSKNKNIPEEKCVNSNVELNSGVKAESLNK